ncbi:hypothetical protein DFS34DRAFT_141032 [Phlyctochytrium arcticum]|nr:hypothetical protein DFS34DRAFT_141032 [Phlyctochytrium arcticum]
MNVCSCHLAHTSLYTRKSCQWMESTSVKPMRGGQSISAEMGHFGPIDGIRQHSSSVLVRPCALVNQSCHVKFRLLRRVGANSALWNIAIYDLTMSSPIQHLLDTLPVDIPWTDHQLLSLAVVFGPTTTLASLALVDSLAVTQVLGPADRCFYQVEDESDFVTCFPDELFCTCREQRDMPICQHILAVHLARKLKLIQILPWEGSDFLNHLAGW